MAGLNVIITGASSGIGRALVIEASAQGAHVGVTARRAELLETLVQEVRANGGIIEAEVADVTMRENLHAAIANLVQKLGPVDMLIANAGVGIASGANPMNVDGVETMMRVNYLGAMWSIEAVLPEMLKRGRGRIAAVSSLAAYKGMPGSAGYCASKAAISSYCESLRIELRSRGISVTTVCPGFIRSPMTDRNKFPMPFLMDPDVAAKRILRAINRGTKVYNFPWMMTRMMRLTYWLPDWIMARVATKPNFPE
jgi:short-subunit dehydrogenase